MSNKHVFCKKIRSGNHDGEILNNSSKTFLKRFWGGSFEIVPTCSMLTVFFHVHFGELEVLLWPFILAVHRGRPWTMMVNPGSTTRLKYVNSQALVSLRLSLERTSISFNIYHIYYNNICCICYVILTLTVFQNGNFWISAVDHYILKRKNHKIIPILYG